MLYWLFQQLAEVNTGFNVFAYITLRSSSTFRSRIT